LEGASPTPFADAARDAKANATKKIDDVEGHRAR